MADPNSPFVNSGPGLDTYRSDGTCSYCGSMNENTFMERLENEDVELGPTDKNYKVYVNNAGGEPFTQSYRDCPPPDVKVVDGKEVTTKCAGPDTCPHWVTRDVQTTKFYFQHLTKEQKERFIELLNKKKLKIGYPGHFYKLPFFIVKT